MRFLPLIWSGIWRRPGRSILIFLQVSVAFALFGVLQGMKTGVEALIARARADLLLVHGSLSLIDPLPLGLHAQIKSVPGVAAVVPVELFGGIYQKPTQQVGIVAIRPDAGWLSLGYSFQLSVTFSLAVLGIEWALAMGLLGGLLPALRAARMPVVTALRAI